MRGSAFRALTSGSNGSCEQCAFRSLQDFLKVIDTFKTFQDDQVMVWKAWAVGAGMNSGDTIRLTLRWSFTFAFHFSVSFFSLSPLSFFFHFLSFFLLLFNLIFPLLLINFFFSHSHFHFHLITYQSGIQRHSLFLHNGNHSKNVFMYPVPDSKPHPPTTSHTKKCFFSL